MRTGGAWGRCARFGELESAVMDRVWAAGHEDYTAHLMGEAFDVSTDRVATLRRFVQRIGTVEAGEMRAMRGCRVVIVVVTLLGYADRVRDGAARQPVSPGSRRAARPPRWPDLLTP